MKNDKQSEHSFNNNGFYRKKSAHEIGFHSSSNITYTTYNSNYNTKEKKG